MDDDPFTHLCWGWRFLLSDHGWVVIDGRSIERMRGRWPTWRTCNYGGLTMQYVVTVRGKRHEWSIPCPEAAVDGLRDDGFEVLEVANTIPATVANLGLTRPWCALQDLWRLPSRLLRQGRRATPSKED